MAAGNTPEVDKLLLAAKEKKELTQDNIDESDLAVVIDNSQELTDKAKLTLKTQEQWKHLKDIIEREERDTKNKDVVDDGREKLNALRADIDAQLAANIPTVSDLEAAPDQTKPKKFIEQVKDGLGGFGVGAMSMVVKGWISIQRTLIDLGIVQGDKAKLDKIEELYGNWFGAAEMREQISATLKTGNIEVRKGRQDGLAYNMLKEGYATWILKKIPERKDATGKVVPPTEALINSVKQGSKIEMYLREEATKYKDTFGGPAEPGKKRVTTIMGIANSEKPTTEIG